MISPCHDIYDVGQQERFPAPKVRQLQLPHVALKGGHRPHGVVLPGFCQGQKAHGIPPEVVLRKGKCSPIEPFKKYTPSCRRPIASRQILHTLYQELHPSVNCLSSALQPSILFCCLKIVGLTHFAAPASAPRCTVKPCIQIDMNRLKYRSLVNIQIWLAHLTKKFLTPPDWKVL